MLLSHTAGFTREAPVGNNNELDPADFDAHVRSISETWLRFPVGSGCAYSNLGIDLGGYILERIEAKPFPDVVRDSLLASLGTDHSTFDRTAIRSTEDRAIGHVRPYAEPPLDVPMTAAGGLYTSAADLARFLRFELNDGSINDRVVLDPKRMDEMRTVPAPRAPRRRPGRLCAWGRQAPLESMVGAARSVRTRRRWLRVPVRPVVAAGAGDRDRDPHQLGGPSAAGRPRAVDLGRPGDRAGPLSRPAARAPGSSLGRRSEPFIRAPGEHGGPRRQHRHAPDR